MDDRVQLDENCIAIRIFSVYCRSLTELVAPDSGWKSFPESEIPKISREGHIFLNLVSAGPSCRESAEDNSPLTLTLTPQSQGETVFTEWSCYLSEG